MDLASPQLMPLYYAIVLGAFVWDQWRRFRKVQPDRRITYRITEIWAAIVGLTPSFALFAFAVKRDADTVYMSICFTLSQIAGILALKLSHEQDPGANEPITSVLLGAALGMFLSVVVPIAIIFIVAAIVFLPLTIVFVAGGLLFWASQRSATRKMESEKAIIHPQK